jgi:two-component system, OmpR family, response regulator MprA
VTARGRILIVDDEPAVRATLGELLQDLGYQVNTAADGQQAIDAMSGVRPQVVFLDLLMPGISGLEALTYFRQHHRRVPVIVITGGLDQDTANQVRAGGAFEIIGKPFDIDALTRLLARAMQLAPAS